MSAIARNRMQNWEIIADNLSKAGWSLGWISAVDCEGRTIWIADAHREDGKRTDEKLTAFLEVDVAIRAAERPEDCGVASRNLCKWL